MKLKGVQPVHDKAFEALIEAGYQVLDNDFNETDFRKWREKAIDCISILLGVDHPYARSFSDYVRNSDLNSLFLGRGLVDAAKREVLMTMRLSGKELESS